ncbi:MAG: sigma-70 family RNA polymerase sigma factor [Rhodothermales bacterium]|nr:sigma-70 family RNA polymerase sigma factor [Rhodothermales bacterium]
MTDSLTHTVTRLLDAARDGDERALDRLFPLVYEHLHALARQQRRRWHGDYTLNTTALVHEAYLKLVDQSHPAYENRTHFLGVAAKAMRHILINYAEKRRAQKRGGDVPKVSLEEDRAAAEDAAIMSLDQAERLLALNEALEALERAYPRQVRIVECRFFAGMTNEETAAILGISPATVKRDWAMARVWLYRHIREDSGEMFA